MSIQSNHYPETLASREADDRYHEQAMYAFLSSARDLAGVGYTLPELVAELERALRPDEPADVPVGADPIPL
jgi:hypothetical protein